MRKARALRVALVLVALAGLSASRPAAAQRFECANASLRVDYVICRSAQGMQAIGELQATWDQTYASVPREQQASLVRDEVRWIKAYAATCGVGGRGLAPLDPTGQTDACVVDQIRRRTAELRARAGGAPSQAGAYGAQPFGTDGAPPQGYAGNAAPQGTEGLAFSPQGGPYPYPGTTAPYAPSGDPASPYAGAAGWPGASGPTHGFDCAKASLKVDYVICRSGPGMQAIGELQTAWDQTYATVQPEQRASLVRDEVRWIKAYAAECGVGGKGVARADPTGRTEACVVDQIRRRTAELHARAGGAPSQAGAYGGQPFGTDGAPPQGYAGNAAPQGPFGDQASYAGSAGSQGASGPAPDSGRYPIEQLRQPGAGLRPLRIDTFQGRPVFPSLDERAFFRLVALGMKPDLIQADDQMSDFAREFLTNDNPYQSLAGADEFTTRDKRQQFLAIYGSKLRGLAPRAPFEFVYRFDVDLPEYDASRGGFLLPMPSANDLRPAADIHFVGPSDWPSGLWPVDDYRALLARLRQEQPSGGRRVRLLAVVRAVAADPEEMNLELKLVDVAVYNQSMTRKLYDFQVRGAPTPALAPNNSLAALAKPPAGLRPWILPALNGLPMFDSERGSRQVTSDSPPPLAVLAMFMGAANVPGAMERDGKALAGLLLTDDAESQVLSPDPTHWRGENEFEKASGETLFFSKYAPLIRQAAPRPPFRFVYSFAVGLPAYDKNNSGFPLTFDAGTLTGLVGQGNLIAELQFSWPDVFWKLTPKDAEALFADLKRNQAPNGRPELRFAAEIEAVSLDPATRKLRLQLRSLKLYTPDFRRLVHEFPVINDAASFATSRPPRALRLPTPVVLDEIAQCAEVIAALGDKAPENLIKRCFALVAERDASFYAHGGASAALAANDARLPFFPRSGPAGSRSEAAAFIAWAKSYAAGIPDTVQTSPEGPSGSEQNGDVTFAAVARGPSGQGLPGAALEAEGLQADQVVSYGRLEQVDLLMALPNRAQSYGVSVPKSAFGAAQGAAAQSVIRIGKPRALTGESGAPVVLMDVTPLRTVVSANGNIIGARNYQDVARLGEGFANPPPTAPRPMAKGPIRLDAPFIDLLIASTVGDQLSRRSLAHLVLRRWALENPPAYRGPRFFVLGKRAPNPQEAASLGPDFIQWATAIAPALPLDVVTSSPIEIRANQTSARWGDLPCFSGSYDSIMQDLNRAMAANAGAASCERGAETLTSDEQRACAAARAISRTEDYLRQVGGECQARDVLSSFADPLRVVVRLGHDMPAPSLSLLEDRAKLIAAVTLKLTAIKISDIPLAAADVLPEAIRGPKPESQQTGGPRDFVTLDARFLRAVYLDPRTQAVVATLGPDHGGDIASIVRDYDAAAAEIVKSRQTPSTPYWRDLVGIRLGMSFDEAEAIVRQHMQVAKVYQGMRATDPKAHAGYPKAFTSGKLFVSGMGAR
jgi:uncharacterized protein YecT (DUF1311 family)